jgi:hypothetical protein
MYTNLEIVTNIAKQLAERIETRALLADTTDFNDPEMVATLHAISDEINELFDRQEYYLGKIMAKQITKEAA